MKAPEEIHGISNSQLSVARHFGGCKYMGASYHYDASQDALIRMDVWQKRMHEDSAAGKAARDADRSKWEALQAKLFLAVLSLPIVPRQHIINRLYGLDLRQPCRRPKKRRNVRHNG